MKKIIIGFVISVFIIFAACQKEEVSPSYPPVEISGTYLGSYKKIDINSVNGYSSSLVDGNAYAVVDTIRDKVYQVIISDDSLLTGIIYDTLTIKLQNDPLYGCGEGESYFGNGLPGGAMHYVTMKVNCDTIRGETRYYPYSSRYGWGSKFFGIKCR